MRSLPDSRTLRSLVNADRKAANALLRALSAFTELRNDIPTQFVRAFLLIAMDEGKTVGEYATKSGVSKSVMSRHILDLSDGSRRVGEEGLGLLVNRINLANRREHTVHLTEKGRTLLDKIIRYLEY